MARTDQTYAPNTINTSEICDTSRTTRGGSEAITEFARELIVDTYCEWSVLTICPMTSGHLLAPRGWQCCGGRSLHKLIGHVSQGLPLVLSRPARVARANCELTEVYILSGQISPSSPKINMH